MAFPSNIGSSPLSLSDAFERTRQIAGQIKSAAVALRDKSAAGPVSATDIVGHTGSLADQRARLVAAGNTPGLATYALEQYPALDLAAAYTAMLAQIDATILWIRTNFPTAGTGEILERRFDTQGRTTPNTFSTAALANFRTQLDALIATID